MTTNTQIEFKVNKAFEKALFDDSPYLILYGSAGSGKSFFAAQKIILRVIDEEQFRALVVMKIGSKLRQYAFQTIIDVINMYGMQDLFNYTVAPLEITCKENGNKILFTGLDDPEGLKSIANINNVWIEEATSLQRNDFQQLNIRIRGDSKVKYKQIMLTFNPVSKQNWIYEDFFQNLQYHPVGIYKSTYKDNEYIGDDYEDRIRQSYKNDLNQLGVYLSGIWGERSSNRIYTNWRVEEIPTQFEAYKYKYAGVDFGFNDPNVLLCGGVIENKLYIFDEIYKTGITLNKFIEEIKNKVPRHILVIADARSPGNILEMQNKGIYVRPSDKKPNSIMAGINFLKGMEIIIHPRCKNTIEEIGAYSYIYNEDNNTYFDKPSSGNDHAMDTMRYLADPIRLMKRVTAGIRI